MKQVLVWLTILTILLTACNGSSSVDEEPAPQVEQPTEIAAPAPTMTPLPEPTPTPVPTETSQPESPPVEQEEAVEEESAPDEPISEAVEEESAPDEPISEAAILEIVNTTDVEICDIAITPSGAEELSDNILDDVLVSGDSFIYAEVEAGLYDFLAVDCNDEVVTELFEVSLGEESFVWQIGEDIASTEEASQPEEAETAAQPAPTELSGVFQVAECPFDVLSGVVVECGFLSVPENRSKADSPDIELAVAILRAAGAEVQPDPIIFLDGGPGSSALVSLSEDFEGWIDYPFHQDHDMIFIDQRGTGYSRPTLNCPEVEAGEDDAELACHARLVAEGIDLTAYNTAENASDIEALRNALGYEQVNLFGVSYGTRLGLVVMRDHPQGIRSVVLDSPFPPNIDLPAEEGISNLAAIRVLMSECGGDPLCNESYPDLEATLLEIVFRLNDSPAEFDGVELYGDDVTNAIVQALYIPDLISLLPRMIYELSQDNLDTYDIIAAEALGGSTSIRFQGGDEDRSDSEGMFNSVTCHDEYAFGNLQAAEARALGEIPEALQPALFFSNSASLFEVCDFWGAGQAAPIENEPVVSDIPTLILAGQFDPVTPPQWGRLTAETLSNAYFFELPGFGHSLSSDPGCPTTLITQFFNNPTVQPDSSCINELPGPDFFLPGDPLDF